MEGVPRGVSYPGRGRNWSTDRDGSKHVPFEALEEFLCGQSPDQEEVDGGRAQIGAVGRLRRTLRPH